jgi:hypothetical protein
VRIRKDQTQDDSEKAIDYGRDIRIEPNGSNITLKGAWVYQALSLELNCSNKKI